MLQSKKNLRLMRVAPGSEPLVIKSISGGYLAQTPDTHQLDRKNMEVKSKRPPSEEEWAALEFAWKNFGHYSEFRLRDITHHYPEWKRHAAKLRGDGRKRVGMHYSDFFAEPDAGYNPCHELSAKDRAVAVDLFRDHEAFHYERLIEGSRKRVSRVIPIA